ncbi:MAG TPA: hypothetical protein VGM30_10575 [Puia sp.]|jgi:hypothetical protein
MKDLRKEADEIYQEFADGLFNQFKKERFGIGCQIRNDPRTIQNRRQLLEWQNGIYDEIFDRISCHSDNTSCGHNINTAVAFFGWLPDASILINNDVIRTVAKGNAYYVRGGSIKCDYTINLVPQILWMAELATEPLKRKYVVDEGMEGDIGDPDNDLFGTPVLVGMYRLYMTAYPTQQNENSIEFKVNN